MTATQKFIEDAIEGGWFKHEDLPPVDVYAYRYFPSSFLLDPAAWQAVGNVRGWGPPPSVYAGRWVQNMHGLIDALAEGKSIEDYLSTI